MASLIRAPLQLQRTRLFSTASLTSQFGGVHGTRPATQMQWRNKPLFRSSGDVKFKTGSEAADLLNAFAQKRDSNQVLFLQTFQSCITALAPLFDRNPKFAWIAKQLVEPERLIQFRVAWLDDTGILRVNRGYRVQYSSSLGPYDGGLHFGKHVSTDFVKAAAFDALCSNALAGLNAGAAAGGADFDPKNKSESEIQRFCQCFMSELSKYIGPELDMPTMGGGVGEREIGYLYGQYKRVHSVGSRKGSGFLWGGQVPWPQASGFGVAHFAERLLKEKKETLAGKRVMITGSGDLALAVAERVIRFGGIVITLSDSSGFIYEEDGIDLGKLETIKKIKAERGARIGRYIVASTTAKYKDAEESIFSVPCQVCIPCSSHANEIDQAEATRLMDGGCSALIEGATMPTTPAAIAAFKKRGMIFAPYKATHAVGSVANGGPLMEEPLKSLELLDKALETRAEEVLATIKATAKEFNTRGDLHAGAQLAAFIRVADLMVLHGAV